MSDRALTASSQRPAKTPPERVSASEDRYRLLSRVLESFTTTLDLDEVLKRIATVTLGEFKAVRVLLIHPIADGATTATTRYAVNAPDCPVKIESGSPARLTPALMRRALESEEP